MLGKLTLILFKFLIVSVLLGQLSRIPLPGGADGAIYLSDLVLAGLVATWFGWHILNRKTFWISSIEFAGIIFLFTTLLSLIYALHWIGPTQFVIGFSYWIRITMYLILFGISIDLRRESNYNPTNLLSLGVFVFALIGLAQFVLFPDFSKYVEHGWDPHYYRVLSTFFDPNYAGMFLVLGLILLLNQFYRSHRKTEWFVLLMETFTVAISLVLTFSRSSYLAAAFGLAIFSWFKDKRILLGLAAVGLVTFMLVPRVQERVIGALNLDETAQLRLQNYTQTFEVIKDNPILGVGFNVFRFSQEKYGYFRDSRGVNQPSGHAGAGADNSFLFLWATGGTVSLFSLLLLIFSALVKSFRSNERALLMSTLVALIIHAQFVNTLFYTWVLAWVVIVFGMTLCTVKS